MSELSIIEVLKVVAPALAAYISVRVTLAEALEKAKTALESSVRAHQRIDSILRNGR